MTGPQDTQDLRTVLRAHDPDRYLTARFAPKPARASLTALYAFHAELARIPDLVSEPALGEIRLQWWRDVLEQPKREARTGAPIADALAAAITAHALPKAMLLGMVDARSADLDGGGFADLQALKAYLYKREGTVFTLSARIAGDIDATVGRIANAAGLAYGLATLLRSLPRDAAAGRVMVPLALLKDHGVAPEAILAGEESEAVAAVVSACAEEVRAALAAARDGIAKLEPALGPVFAPVALVERYVAVLERPGNRPLHDIADINPLERFVRLWHASRGRR